MSRPLGVLVTLPLIALSACAVAGSAGPHLPVRRADGRAPGPSLAGAALVLATATLDTCSAGTEGIVRRDATAGGTSGARTRICMCASDGAGSPAYAWVSLGSGTVGTATTCNP